MHKKGRPLLYVNQPEFPEIKPVMQHYFQAPSSQEKTPVKKTKVQPLGYVEEVELEKPLKENETVKEKSFMFKELKPFKKMTLQEKVDYLLSFEGRKAPFQCRFIKDDGSEISGVVTRRDHQKILIRTLKGEEADLNKNDLVDIQIY
ncbi:CotO family spore coat protein [Jeotgalibacillus salarius]|uniref:Spore coat protein CotO n=1 Tax=Jeotgalibacillus salarius TaxID=546023 RepID=A0A4Y8LE13_9BACL|nr:CotO family spore coat protein [Jeotgalibacillus salarius]TFD99300.1 hypothetical protein E2626_15115 [Jeotgalibacillus salarius]